jgi:hypothetical protein
MSTSMEEQRLYADSSRMRTSVQYMFRASRNLASTSNTVRGAGCLRVGSARGRLATSRDHDPDGDIRFDIVTH